MKGNNARAIIRHGKHHIAVLCPIGHLITAIRTDKTFAGSTHEAELGKHAAGLPNLYDRLASKCDGSGH